MLPGERHVKFTPKFVRPNWFPRGCLLRPFMSEARGSGNINIGTRAGADTASMAAAVESLDTVTPKPNGCAKSNYFRAYFDPAGRLSVGPGLVQPTEQSSWLVMRRGP